MTVTTESDQGSDSQASEVSTRRLRWWGALRIIGTLSLVAAVFVAAVVGLVPTNKNEAFGWVTIVIGDWVPTWWTLEATLIATGTVALLASTIIMPFPPARPGRGLRILVAVVLVLTVPVSFLLVGLGASSNTVLPEQSHGGCRIVVREYSSPPLGWGSVGIVQPGSVTVEWLGEYWADDGHMPFSRGTYSLEWNENAGDVHIFDGPSGGAAWATEKPTITCAR